MKNDHLAICTVPGKGHYYNGHLIGEPGRYGYIKIDEEKIYVNDSYRFLKLFPLQANQKVLLSIQCWCRAIGISRGEPETASLWYWLDDSRQIISLEYTVGDSRYMEEHTFAFTSAGVMTREDAKVRKLE